MKQDMIFGLMLGGMIGAVVTTMCKPARDAVRKTTDAAIKKAKQMSQDQ